MVGEIFVDPWRYQLHLEVWLLVAFLVGSYIYVVRVLGPRAVPAGEPIVTRRQLVCFITGILIMFLSTDWPMHDIAEEYLYSVHMFQHMSLTYCRLWWCWQRQSGLFESSWATDGLIASYSSSHSQYGRDCYSI